MPLCKNCKTVGVKGTQCKACLIGILDDEDVRSLEERYILARGLLTNADGMSEKDPRGQRMYTSAMHIFKTLEGYTDALFFIANLHMLGLGVTQDVALAKATLERGMKHKCKKCKKMYSMTDWESLLGEK